MAVPDSNARAALTTQRKRSRFAAPSSRFGRQQERLAWLLTLPSLLVVVGIAIYPLIMSFFWSLTNLRLTRVNQWRYIGFSNYENILTDSRFLQALSNTGLFTFSSVALETILGMIVALTIHSNFYGRGLVRTSMLVPWAIPTVVSSLLWTWMLNDRYGVINSILVETLGIKQFQNFAWTVRPDTALWSVVAVDVWKTTPFMALLLLAGLQVIPEDVYEAARVDGGSKWAQFWDITLPLLRPALVVALIFRTLASFSVFDMIYVIKGTATETISVAVYAHQEIMAKQRVGFGSAAAVIIFICVAILVAIYSRLIKVEEG